ncbi:MAG: hypothetical protein M0C28_42120 [Candidatus Moduliflexus flocculans]|nr:hypothetical protein [Candidatus Moduliflexus flocculans]
MRRHARSFVAAALAALAISIAAPAAPAAPAVRASRPRPGAEKPATTHLKAYIEAFNSGSLDKMKAFFEAHFAASALQELPVPQRLARYQSGKIQLKSFEIQRVVAELEHQTAILTKAGNGNDILLRASSRRRRPASSWPSWPTGSRTRP